MKSTVPIIAHKELFRLWYEFYKLALTSDDPEVQKALKKSRAFYAEWGNDPNIHFDDWWRDHRKLFHDDRRVRFLDQNEVMSANEFAVIVPRDMSPKVVVKEFRELLSKELPAFKTGRVLPPKHKYAPTEIQGVKRDSLRMMLDLQKSIFLKKEYKGYLLTKRVIEFFSTERYKRRQNIVPKSFQISRDSLNDKIEEVDRNVRRYRQKANKLILNVARGEFPGKY